MAEEAPVATKPTGLKRYLCYERFIFEKAWCNFKAWFRRHPVISFEGIIGAGVLIVTLNPDKLLDQIVQTIVVTLVLCALVFLWCSCRAGYDAFTEIDDINAKLRQQVLTLKRGKSNVALIKDRQQWRAEFEAHLPPLDEYKTHGNAIIRDVARVDSYPDIDTQGEGMSPWFKVEIKGLYHRGMELYMRAETLKQDKDTGKWHYAKHGEPDSIYAYLVGRIPFDVVRSVDWEGDEYKSIPHIYCEFSKQNNQPFEEYVFYMSVGKRPYDTLSEIVKLQDVQPAT